MREKEREREAGERGAPKEEEGADQLMQRESMSCGLRMASKEKSKREKCQVRPKNQLGARSLSRRSIVAARVKPKRSAMRETEEGRGGESKRERERERGRERGRRK
jgi:hypothetical protein